MTRLDLIWLLISLSGCGLDYPELGNMWTCTAQLKCDGVDYELTSTWCSPKEDEALDYFNSWATAVPMRYNCKSSTLYEVTCSTPGTFESRCVEQSH